MPQNKITYNKPTLTYAAQLQQLRNRGMIIKDEVKALHLLENIGYYRLSGYWYPLLLDKKNHIFKPTAAFDTSFRLYCFDKELRKLLLYELEEIEVAVRAKMIYILSHQHGPFWFQNPVLFKNPINHANSLSNLGKEYERSDEEFINAFRNKYLDPLPPSWIMLEITSFGTLSMLYKNLKPGREKREIAHYFGLADSVFETWLHSIAYLRNICAHHSRLWNKTMSIRPQFPLSPRKTWIANTSVNNRRIYFMLCVIKYLLQTVNPNSTFSAKIKTLLNNYNNVSVDAMGFPPSWESESLWL